MIKPLYQAIGLILQDSFAGSGIDPMLGILASNVEQVDILPIKEPKTLRCHNGAITVYFRYGTLIAGQTGNLVSRFEKREIEVEEGQDFINRLQKNLSKLKKLAKKDKVSNLRVYNADLPDFKVAVDLYGDYVHVQEYAPPKTIPPETAKKRFNLALMVFVKFLVLTVNKYSSRPVHASLVMTNIANRTPQKSVVNFMLHVKMVRIFTSTLRTI